MMMVLVSKQHIVTTKYKMQATSLHYHTKMQGK